MKETQQELEEFFGRAMGAFLMIRKLNRNIKTLLFLLITIMYKGS
jgi:hypothetical protein